MGYGLFGKLPQKRDFVSVGLPHQVLHPFETWLQSAVAASHNEIGRDWQNYYMVAPIWNFWLGPQIMGTTCAGALMPSVDQVGRYFPLAIIYVAEPGEELPPPLLDQMGDWYRQIDQRLLDVLAAEGQLEIASVVSGLPLPQPSGTSPIGMANLSAAVVPAAPAEAPRPEAATPPQPAPPPPPVPVAPPEVVPEPPPAAAARAEAPAVPAVESPKSDWDMPAMASDLMESLRRVTAASIDPSDRTTPPTSDPWKGSAASATTEPPVAVAEAAAPAAKEIDDPFAMPAEDAAAEPTPNAASAATAGASQAVAESEPAADPFEAPPPADLPPAAPPAPAQDWVAPRIHATDFKGGVLALVEPGRSLAEAAGALIEADYRNASLGRSFWWCETSQSGSAQLHTRQGLPDPYFFSRMLMWQPR